jgi:hypothetical protein
MKSFVPVLALVTVAMLAPALARAQHDVPVWYLEYEVTMKANHTAATSASSGPTSTTWVFERVFAASAKLDMRNEGSVIGTSQAAMADPEKFKNMSQAEMMKYSQDMLAAMQYTANWMPGPLDLGEEPDAMLNHMKSVSVPVRFHYQVATTGKDLVDEMGNKFDYSRVHTGTATGGKLHLGDLYKFEINTQSKKYWLALPFNGQDIDPLTRLIKWETVDKTRMEGSSKWEETRKTDDSEIDWLPLLEIESAGESTLGASPLIEGTLAGPDKITGEKTFTAHFSDMAVNVPVTITVRYALTSTPPARKAAAGAEKK